MAPQLQPSRFAFGQLRPVIRSFFSQVGKSYLIFPAAFLTSTAIGSSNLALIFYVRMSFGFSPVAVGWFAACYSIFYFAGCLLLRPIGRHLLPRYSLLTATGLMGTIMLALIIINNPIASFFLYSLYGLSASLFWPPVMGWLSSGLEGEQLNTTISRFNLSWSTGTIISPYLAGALAEIHNRIPIYMSIALLYAVAILIGTASIYWAKIRTDRYIEPEPARMRSDADESTPLRFPAWVGLATTWVALGVLGNIFPVFARDHSILSKGQIGLVLLMRALMSTATFVVLGRSSFWHHKRSFIVLGQVAAAACVLVMLFMGTFVGFIIAVLLFGGIVSMVYSASIFHGVSGSSERARRMSVHESTATGGVVIGSIFGGWLYQAHSMRLVWICCIGVALAGAVAQLLLFSIVGARRGNAQSRV